RPASRAGAPDDRPPLTRFEYSSARTARHDLAHLEYTRCARRARVVGRSGWFRSERSLLFDFSSCFSSVDQWLRHREDRRVTSVLAPDIVARARQFLAASGGEVCVTERIQATRLARVER